MTRRIDRSPRDEPTASPAGGEAKSAARPGRTGDVGVATDVTERKSAEEGVRRWQEIFQNIAWGVAVGNPDPPTLLTMNPAFASMHGYTAEELTGRPFIDVFAPDSKASLPEHIHVAHEKGHHAFEANHIRKDGTVFPVLVDVTTVRDMQGTALYRIISVQDLTLKRNAEEDMRQAMSELVGTLEATNDGILMVDLRGRITRHNRRAREMWRIPEDLVAAGDDRRVLKYVLKQVKEATWFLGKVRELYARPEAESYDVLELNDGRVLEWYSRPIRAGDHIAGRVWSFHDATERRHAEEAVRRSEVAFRALSENAAIGIYRTTPAGAILYANPALYRMLGCDSPEELASLNLDRIYPDMPRRQYLDLIEREGGVQGLEFALQRRDGSLIHVRENARVVRDSNGAVQYYEGALEDVTERKRAEEALRESEERFRSLFENATIGLYRTTPEGHVLMANPTLLRLLGYASFEELSQRDLEAEFEPSYERRQFRERIERDGVIVGLEAKWTRRDGSVIHVRESARAVRDGEGTVTYYEGTVEDISDRIRVEEQLRRLNEDLEQRVKSRTAQLEVANKELEAFSYSVSHDLRAPLRSIDGFSQELLEDHADGLGEGAKQLLQRVRLATQRMSQLIDDLLKLARVTRVEMQRQPVDLSRLAGHIESDLKQRAPNRQVEFTIQPGLTARGDARLLQIALENLLGNSWKFTGKHPRARIEFGAIARGSETVFYVRDDGAGFDPAYTQKLFTSFQRLHSTVEFEGTGIGLATVRQIVERHGGRIWGEGAVERGATFYFTL